VEFRTARKAQLMSRTAIVSLSVAGISLVVLGLLALNAAAFHWWLSWGPPTPNPQRNLVLSVLLLFLALGLGWCGVQCSAVARRNRSLG
jgi:hypothetical protein